MTNSRPPTTVRLAASVMGSLAFMARGVIRRVVSFTRKSCVGSIESQYSVPEARLKRKNQGKKWPNDWGDRMIEEREMVEESSEKGL